MRRPTASVSAACKRKTNPVDRSDIARLEARPGMYGINCAPCDYLFDAFDAPTPLSDALMRMRTLVCPRCGERGGLMLLMPKSYRALVLASVEREERKEAVRQIADKYIPRR